MPMVITLQDRTKASFRHVSGQGKVTFHGLDNKEVIFPAGVQVTLALVEKLYETTKANETKGKGKPQ